MTTLRKRSNAALNQNVSCRQGRQLSNHMPKHAVVVYFHILPGPSSGRASSSCCWYLLFCLRTIFTLLDRFFYRKTAEMRWISRCTVREIYPHRPCKKWEELVRGLWLDAVACFISTCTGRLEVLLFLFLARVIQLARRPGNSMAMLMRCCRILRILHDRRYP